jgi:hypothetical protein
MNICEKKETCVFLKHMEAIVPYAINMVRIKYCEYDKKMCARYTLLQVLHQMEIPDDLWPCDEMKTIAMMEQKFRDDKEGKSQDIE